MKLVKLQIENFRNYPAYSYSFEADPAITVLVGNNGIGKTNFLEAIHVLSLGRSFRTGSKDDLVQWGKEYFRCKGEVVEDLSEDISSPDRTELEVFYSSFPARRRNFRFNGANTTYAKFLGNLITVLFHPEDLNMLYLSPTLRRDYLDTVLSQTDREYVVNLSNYQKVLKQRNSLLGQIREARFQGMSEEKLLLDLDVWDEELVRFGEPVVAKRKGFVDFIGTALSRHYGEISGENDAVRIEYQCNVLHDYAQAVLDRRQIDLIQAKSTRGPHRDDLCFFINEKRIDGIASRGEFRTLLLAIKLAEIDYIKQVRGVYPLLLLDDVFSELDPARQKHLLSAISGCQTIITTTHLESWVDHKGVKVMQL